MTNGSEQLPARIDPWLKLIGSFAGAVAVLWGAVMYLNPLKPVDLTAQIVSETAISLPAEVGPLPVRLLFEDKPINRAVVLQLRITNSGQTAIGDDKQPWTLDLRSAGKATVVPLGDPRPFPSNVQVSVGKSAPSDVIPVQIGLLNKNDYIDLNVIVLNPKDSGSLPVVAHTRVRDLQPVTTRLDVHGRLKNAFTIPLFAVAFIVFMAVLVNELRKSDQLSRWQTAASSLVTAMFYSIMAAAFLTAAVAWILAWLVSAALAK